MLTLKMHQKINSFSFIIYHLTRFKQIQVRFSQQTIHKRMKNIGYLQCQNGGYHTGEFLNIVCLQSSCKNNNICCCACIEQFHQNHKTKTLKKLIIEADGLLKNYQQPIQNKAKQQSPKCNTDIMSNMVQNQEKHVFQRFTSLKKQFIKEIDNLQGNLITYYKKLYEEINNPHQDSQKDLKSTLAENLQLVQGSSNTESLKNNVLKLLKTVSMVQNSISKNSTNSQKPDQESYLNLLKNSNNQITEVVQKKFSEILHMLQKENSVIKNIVPRIDNLWNSSLFKFSNVFHHKNIDVINPFLIKANVDSVYQIAVMEPSLSFSNQIQTFRFRINVCDLEWVSVGVCYKNIVQKNNFEFKFQGLDHGCYMISGNAGCWSHSELDFNNCVKAFNFKQGDSVTCAVYRDKVCFIKDIPAEHEFSEEYSQREYFELMINPQAGDSLHPCVVSYYRNTEVEYLPSFSSQLNQSDLPVFKYKFSSKWKHPNTLILNDVHLYGCGPVEYKCSVLDTPIQDNQQSGKNNEITFRITRSTSAWLGLGLCHKNIIHSNNYDFLFENPGHGCYMISANGGSWSHNNEQYNNIVKTFKFVQGDLVTIELDKQRKKIIFKRTTDRYELPYVPINGDKLYPVVVLYYQDDQVQVLPVFA